MGLSFRAEQVTLSLGKQRPHALYRVSPGECPRILRRRSVRDGVPVDGREPGYNVPIKKTADGYRAEPPDLPDVVAAADTPERVKALVRDAIARRLDAQSGRAQFPVPSAEIVHIEVAVPRAIAS